MEFANELGLRHQQHHRLRPHPLRHLAGQGRRVAGPFHRHPPAGRAAAAPRTSLGSSGSRSDLVRLPREHRRRGVHRRRHRRRTSPGSTTAQTRLQRRTAGAGRAGRRGRPQGRRRDLRRPPADPDEDGHGDSPRSGADQSTAQLAAKGITARELVRGVNTAQVRRLPQRRGGPRRQARSTDASRHRRRRQAGRVRQRRASCSSRCSLAFLVAGIDGPRDEPQHAPAAQRGLRASPSSGCRCWSTSSPGPTPAGSTPGSRPSRSPRTRRDRRGRPRLRPGAPRGRAARRRAGPAAGQRQRDLHQPLAPQPGPHRAPARP